MSKTNAQATKSRWRLSVKNGLTAGGFITAVLVVLAACFFFQVDMRFVAVALAIVVVLVVGVPLAIHAVRENNDVKDEHETCKPILQSFEKHGSTKKLVADYHAWTKGEHSSYTRVHFGGDVVYTLQGAKDYEQALAILDELESIDMKARERYDYEMYRDKVKPELLEAMEKEERHAEERARNKNLRKK